MHGDVIDIVRDPCESILHRLRPRLASLNDLNLHEGKIRCKLQLEVLDILR